MELSLLILAISMGKTILITVALIVFITILASCAGGNRKAVEKEIKALLNDPWTANSESLRLALFGWPTYMEMELKSLSIELSPGSSRKSGGGIAHVIADNINYHCNATISFTYFRSYTGGHGYSGSTGIGLGNFKRESDVDELVSNPSSVVPLNIGERHSGNLSGKASTKLPGDIIANFYSIHLEGTDPGIKVTFENTDSTRFHPTCYIYQNRKFIDQCNMDGNKLKPGKTILMVTAGKKEGDYFLHIEELDEETKSKLR